MDPLPLTKKIIKGEFRSSNMDGDPRSEHAIQLAAQRRSIQEQNLEILDYVKVELEKARQKVVKGENVVKVEVNAEVKPVGTQGERAEKVIKTEENDIDKAKISNEMLKVVIENEKLIKET